MKRQGIISEYVDSSLSSSEEYEYALSNSKSQPRRDGDAYMLKKKPNTQQQRTHLASWHLLLIIKQFFKSAFLPEGYPHSVSSDYLAYQLWDTLQAFCSSMTGALAAHAMFESLGVGDETASAYGATLTWLMRDGSGMMGRIGFAWYQGSALDADSKRWRLYADFINDLSFLVDLCTPLVPKASMIYLIVASSVLKSIVGVAGGATRSALTQHQARNNNMADVSAKDGSQETLVGLVALVLNFALLRLVKDFK